MNINLEREYLNLEEKLGFYFGRLISYPLIPPEHVYFSLTSRCNLRCRMCDIPKNPSRIEDELSVSKIKDIILQIKDMGIKHIIFSGGEPLLREDLIELVEFAVANSIKMVDIITNGILLTDDIIQSLIKLKLNHITISLDGLRESNDKIRGEGVFDKAETNIDKFNYYKSQLDSSFPTVGINFTIMDENINDILPMVEFARAKKCNIIVFQPLLFNNTKMYEKRCNSLWPSEENIFKLKHIVKKVISLKEKSDDLYIYTDKTILKELPNYFMGKRPGSHFKCYEGIKRIVIRCDGKLWSCGGIYSDLNSAALKNIWFSQEAMKVRYDARKCKEHCLQDCVYFPSNILRQIRGFLKELESEPTNDKGQIAEVVFKKIEYYISILTTEEKSSSLNFIERVNFRKQIADLYLVKKEIIRTKRKLVKNKVNKNE